MEMLIQEGAGTTVNCFNLSVKMMGMWGMAWPVFRTRMRTVHAM